MVPFVIDFKVIESIDPSKRNEFISVAFKTNMYTDARDI